MPLNINPLKEKIADLSDQGERMKNVNDMPLLRKEYPKWYGQVKYLTSIYVPQSLPELEKHYLSIAKYIREHPHYPGQSSRRLFEGDLSLQIGILDSILPIFELRVFELKALATGELLESELEQAKILLDHGFIRAAGALAGVSLEAHLKLIHDANGIAIPDKPTIDPLSRNLRRHGLLDLGDEKKCIAMADTRNKCSHSRDTDPAPLEVQELIDDVEGLLRG